MTAEQCFKISLKDKDIDLKTVKVVALLLGYGVSYDALSPFEEREGFFFVFSEGDNKDLLKFCDVEMETYDGEVNRKIQRYRDLSGLERMAVKAIGKKYWENKKC